MENQSINPKVVIGVVAAIAFVAFIIWFIFMSNTPEYKYGQKAVEDAKGAIFTADQYLDGKLDERQFERQLIPYKNKNVEYGDSTYEIYTKIKYMDDIAFTDYDILKYRNELAELIGEKKR